MKLQRKRISKGEKFFTLFMGILIVAIIMAHVLSNRHGI